MKSRRQAAYDGKNAYVPSTTGRSLLLEVASLEIRRPLALLEVADSVFLSVIMFWIQNIKSQTNNYMI
jgi:hypothetical protein